MHYLEDHIHDQAQYNVATLETIKHNMRAQSLFLHGKESFDIDAGTSRRSAWISSHLKSSFVGSGLLSGPLPPAFRLCKTVSKSSFLRDRNSTHTHTDTHARALSTRSPSFPAHDRAQNASRMGTHGPRNCCQCKATSMIP